MAYDILVVGGGPAGLAAALHGRARNKSVLLVSNDPLASPLAKAALVENYPGMPAASGEKILQVMTEQARGQGVEFRQGRVLSVMPMGENFFVSIQSDFAEGKTVILAPGVARAAKKPGEAEFLGRGVSYCATCDGMLYRGKTVVVAGDAPDLEEEISYLRSIGCTVHSVPLKGLEIKGAEKVTSVVTNGTELLCEGVFLLRSSLAPSDLLPGVETEGGYIKVGRGMETNIPGVYAAGDCTGTPLQIAKAVGEGQMAAFSAITRLDAKKSAT